YRARAEFVTDVKKAWESRAEPYTKLKGKADLGDSAAAAKVGRIHLERREYELARKYLEKAPSQREALYDARIGELESTNQDTRETLGQAVGDFPESPDSIDRRMKLSEAHKSRGDAVKAKALATEAATVADKLAGQPEKLAGHDATPGDLLESAASVRE